MKIKFAGYVSLILLLSGCSQNVNLSPNPQPPVKEMIPCAVGLFIDKGQQAQTFTAKDESCALGATNEWRLETGAALSIGAEKTFRKMFQNVELLSDMGEFASKELALLIAPKIKGFYVGRDRRSVLTLACEILNPKGETVYNESISAGSLAESGMNAASCLLPPIVSLLVVSSENLTLNVEDTFNTAFFKLADDILKKVDFTPYLKKLPN